MTVDPKAQRAIDATRRAGAFLWRHRWPSLCVAGALLSPLAYLLFAGDGVAGAVLGSSLLAYGAFLAGAIGIRPPRGYITRRRQAEAVGGRAFTAFTAYIPTGYALLALLTWVFQDRFEFPLLEPVILRYVIVWPFYLWYVLSCAIGGLPCPPPPGLAAAGAAP